MNMLYYSVQSQKQVFLQDLLLNKNPRIFLPGAVDFLKTADVLFFFFIHCSCTSSIQFLCTQFSHAAGKHSEKLKIYQHQTVNNESCQICWFFYITKWKPMVNVLNKDYIKLLMNSEQLCTAEILEWFTAENITYLMICTLA